MTATQHIIHRTGKPSLRFTGEFLFDVSDHGYDDGRDECMTFSLYRTAGGKWVAVSHHETRTMDPDFHGAKVCEEVEEIYKFFGFTAEAMQLYWLAGIEPIEDVE